MTHTVPRNVDGVVESIGEDRCVLAWSRRIELGADHEDWNRHVDWFDRRQRLFVDWQAVAVCPIADDVSEVGAVNHDVRHFKQLGWLVEAVRLIAASVDTSEATADASPPDASARAVASNSQSPE